jgi:hypothetical protein
MQIFPVGRYAVSISLLGTFLANCGTAEVVAPSSNQQRTATAMQTVGSGSWMLPEAESGDLLYVANLDGGSKGNGYVAIYSYPQGKLVGRLDGFNRPNGLCIDRAGNVFVANFYGETIVEYAHGGTKPIETLHDNGTPNGCAIDPLTGDLAVTNNCDGPVGSCTPSGTVLVYAHARGTPKMLTDKYGTEMLFCTYDSDGNLFADGIEYAYHLSFVELRKGSATFSKVALKVPGRPQFAGGLQWARGQLAVAASDGNAVYEYVLDGTRASRAGTTPLKGLRNDYGTNQFQIVDGSLVAPALSTAQHPKGTVEYFNYPDGGNPTKVLTTDVNFPWAATVSPANNRF